MRTRLDKSLITYPYVTPSRGYPMMNLPAPRNKISRAVCAGVRCTRNTTIHTSISIRTLHDEIERASAKLYKRIRSRDNPITAALGNRDTHVHCTYKYQSSHCNNRWYVTANYERHYQNGNNHRKETRVPCVLYASQHTTNSTSRL
jgi:hypothetical protein